MSTSTTEAVARLAERVDARDRGGCAISSLAVLAVTEPLLGGDEAGQERPAPLILRSHAGAPSGV